jgi:hypothetical protein
MSACCASDQIAARLDDRFRLLTGGSRTALPRQQTLRALIDWSYALLTERNGISAAAFDLCRRLDAGGRRSRVRRGEQPARAMAAYDLLTQLANKSLIVVEAERGDETRYRLSETVRQYAREKLLETGDPAVWSRRHLNFFLRHAQEYEPELHGPRLAAGLDRFEVEHDNFRAALAWALSNDPLAALQLARMLGFFWARRGYVSEGAGWLDAALVRAAAAEPAEAKAARPYRLERARALALRALLDFGTLNNVPAARAASEESVQLARELGDDGVLAYALAPLALIAAYWGDPAAAGAAAEEALALARPRNEREVMVWAIGTLGLLRFTADPRTGEGRTLTLEAIKLARQVGDPWNIAQLKLGLGRIVGESGEGSGKPSAYRRGHPPVWRGAGRQHGEFCAHRAGACPARSW